METPLSYLRMRNYSFCRFPDAEDVYPLYFITDSEEFLYMTNSQKRLMKLSIKNFTATILYEAAASNTQGLRIREMKNPDEILIMENPKFKVLNRKTSLIVREGTIPGDLSVYQANTGLFFQSNGQDNNVFFHSSTLSDFETQQSIFYLLWSDWHVFF